MFDGHGVARYERYVRMPDVVHLFGLRNDAADSDRRDISASPGEWCSLGGRWVQTAWRAQIFARGVFPLQDMTCAEFAKHQVASHVHSAGLGFQKLAMYLQCCCENFGWKIVWKLVVFTVGKVVDRTVGKPFLSLLHISREVRDWVYSREVGRLRIVSPELQWIGHVTTLFCETVGRTSMGRRGQQRAAPSEVRGAIFDGKVSESGIPSVCSWLGNQIVSSGTWGRTLSRRGVIASRRSRVICWCHVLQTTWSRSQMRTRRGVAPGAGNISKTYGRAMMTITLLLGTKDDGFRVLTKLGLLSSSCLEVTWSSCGVEKKIDFFDVPLPTLTIGPFLRHCGQTSCVTRRGAALQRGFAPFSLQGVCVGVSSAAIFGSSHFGPSHFCSNLPGVFVVFFLQPLQTWQVMPRKGWSALETPNGWFQVIRGPRPLSVRWPNAKSLVSGTMKPNSTPPRGRWRQERSRGHPEEVWGECQEACLWIGGCHLCHDCQRHLRDVFRGDVVEGFSGEGETECSRAQFIGVKEFVERARKRLVAHVAQRAVLEKELVDGETRCNVWRQKILWFPQGLQSWMPRSLS